MGRGSMKRRSLIAGRDAEAKTSEPPQSSMPPRHRHVPLVYTAIRTRSRNNEPRFSLVA